MKKKRRFLTDEETDYLSVIIAGAMLSDEDDIIDLNIEDFLEFLEYNVSELIYISIVILEKNIADLYWSAK